jgi:hypothetical protein
MNNLINYGQKHIGFSWQGFIVVMLAMLPNILFVIFPPSNMPSKLQSGGILMDILEQGTRMSYIILFIFMTKNTKGNSVWLIGSIVSLLVYYSLWIQYFMYGRDYIMLFSNKFFGIPLPMAVFPILYFIFAALWFNSIPIVTLVVLFAVGHIVNSYTTLQQLLVIKTR